MSTSVNLLNVDPTQTQFNEINALINTINGNISDLEEELTSEMNNVNTLLNLKANSVDVNNSIIGINARLDTNINSADLATTINTLNTATANALNANSVSLLTILTLTNSSIQSELDTKANLSDMVSGFTNINTNITGINNNLPETLAINKSLDAQYANCIQRRNEFEESKIKDLIEID
jgi:hypothetical protein